MAMRIIVDMEFGDGEWWDVASRTCPFSEMKPIFEGYQPEIEVSDYVGEEIETWGKTIDGWNDGTEYASHPLLFNPVDEA